MPDRKYEKPRDLMEALDALSVKTPTPVDYDWKEDYIQHLETKYANFS
jgi:hypothetical protein